MPRTYPEKTYTKEESVIVKVRVNRGLVLSDRNVGRMYGDNVYELPLYRAKQLGPKRVTILDEPKPAKVEEPIVKKTPEPPAASAKKGFDRMVGSAPAKDK